MLSFAITTHAFPVIAINKWKQRHMQRQMQRVSLSASIHHDSLRVLEWDKLCDLVASFATTSLGRQALKDQLWSLNQTFEESLKLLEETNAAVEMNKHGTLRLHLGHLDAMLVKTAIQHARRSIPVSGYEARAIVALLQCAEIVQGDLKAVIKEDKDWHNRFMPLTEVIMEFVINRSLIKAIEQVVDEDGSIKDSASPALKQARQQVQVIERKVQQLIESIIRNEKSETSTLEVNNIDGRWCVRVDSGQKTSFKGLLLSSGSGVGSTIEPLSAVPLNDELQRARSLVVKAEADVLLALTKKLDLDDIEKTLNSLVELDVINARATYGLSFGGSSPHIFLPDRSSSSTAEAFLPRSENLYGPLPSKREWTLYLLKAYHPLLLQRHKEKLRKAKKNVNLATSDAALDNAPPVPVDFLVSQKTRVIVITGPNTGGKTICLKTVGLAAMMAKSGLYVLASESAQIPWFDSVFADIGDEQSLSQSLSTFSGHLKQISNIKSQSTSQSLVLLDEVGAGTNPLEGAALGMALLESFAQDSCLLTMATTHHGELKTLKYSDEAFENACMEFDEVNLKPTYKVLWGVPGRSNAINIAERLGLPSVVVDTARMLYGSASAEIDEVITDMERLKQEYQELLDEARHYLRHSRGLYNSLLNTRRKIIEYSTNLRFKKMRDVSEAAAMARSILHKKVRELDASAKLPSQNNKTISSSNLSATNKSQTVAENKEPTIADKSASSVKVFNRSRSDKSGPPKVGDMVHVSSLGKQVTVLKVDSSKGEIVVQAGNMKLKLKLTDIQRS
ncbi:Endonuclease MutS2 [Glycine soja]|uniref:Endonuclease MutS2 n=1 Tax=Glycine soja TaxID=3848 RepID=A0A445LSH0_GLYSO|nr:Endonuclease MutS2 [Glycine soja]